MQDLKNEIDSKPQNVKEKITKVQIWAREARPRFYRSIFAPYFVGYGVDFGFEISRHLSSRPGPIQKKH